LVGKIVRIFSDQPEILWKRRIFFDSLVFCFLLCGKFGI
jgi:hypothetical protein